jgi:hypothetical protein
VLHKAGRKHDSAAGNERQGCLREHDPTQPNRGNDAGHEWERAEIEEDKAG